MEKYLRIRRAETLLHAAAKNVLQAIEYSETPVRALAETAKAIEKLAKAQTEFYLIETNQ